MAYGTVKADSITFTSNSADVTTTLSGIYASTTNNLTLTGTASAVTFTGTTANFVSGVFSTQVSGVTITGTTVASTTGTFTSLTGTTATFTSGIIASGTAALPSLAILSDPNTGIFSPGADQVAISTNGTEKLRVLSNGNVGIGASAPQANLEIYPGTISGSNTKEIIRLDVPGDTISSTALGYINFRGYDVSNSSVNQDIAHIGARLVADGTSTNRFGADLLFYTRPTGAGQVPTERVRITSAGLVGIGTTSPGYLVTAATSADGVDGVSVESPSVNGVIRLRADGTNGNAIRVGGVGAQANTLRFLVASDTERMRIDSSGRLLVGTSSALSVAGKINTLYTSSVESGISIQSSVDSYNTAVSFLNTSGTQVGYISTGASNTTYNTSSDYRLKENVTPVPNGITRLLQLKPSRFNFIADPDHTVDGFIAHEAQAVVPECVTGEKDAVDEDGNPRYQGIDQSKLVPLLTAALQEAIAKIETLEQRFTAAGID